jgi:hypothetical protein
VTEFDDLRRRIGDLERVAEQQRGSARGARWRAIASGDRESADAAAAATRASAEADEALQRALKEFESFTDPRDNVSRLPDQTPFLLLPLRLETRFGTGTDPDTGRQRSELWVRIYPDDCSVTAFDPELSVGEVEAATRFWQQFWRAGGVEAESRAAWRNLAGAYGVGRAAWIVDSFTPVNEGDLPTKDPATEIVLVVGSTAPPADPVRAALTTYWTAAWRADGDQSDLGAARTALAAALGGQPSADDAIAAFPPFNLADPAPPDRTHDTADVTVAWLQLPTETGEERLGWRGAPTARALPERFVLMLYPAGGGTPVPAPCSPIVEPIYVGPDPSADPITPDNGGLQIPDELAWMFDFKRACDIGMGVVVPLEDQNQVDNGFDRIVALGVRMRSSEEDAADRVEQLLIAHTCSRSGFELLRQGTPTNNSDAGPTSWSRRDDPDLAYDDVFGPAKFTLTPDPLQQRDGQVLAERLGLDPAVFQRTRGADGRDHMEALAMNAALAPGTLGYTAGTMLSPVLDGWEEELSWFFTHHVTGRGAIPPLRIGAQPYGIVASTAYSRMKWVQRALLPHTTTVAIDRRAMFLAHLWGVLDRLEPLWRQQLGSVSHVGADGDPHRTLLGAMGLHPNSAEFHIRYGKHLDELWSRGQLALLNILVAIQASQQRQAALDLLHGLGYAGEDPQLVDLFFRMSPSALVGPLIEALPLSETNGLGVATTNGRSYLQWLSDAAGTSLDALRRQEGFVGDSPPQALLYVLLQFALCRGYLDAGDRLRRGSGLFEPEDLLAMRREPTSTHVTATPGKWEGSWLRLYDVDDRLTGNAGLSIGEHLTAVLDDPPDYAVDLADQVRALAVLRDAPTARLERALVEHIDTLSYRLDSWRLGVVDRQLERMRLQRKTGVHLGYYGWLEDVRPKERPLPPPLTPPQEETFGGIDDLVVDPTNGGHLHAPSLNQAVTAAVLRAGELSTRTTTSPGKYSINLASERVRQASQLIEGLRTGQSIGALLGYRFERALHDRGGVVELDELVFKFRRAFPLSAGRLSTTQDPPPPETEAVEARNVTDGLALAKAGGPEASYPYGNALLPPRSALGPGVAGAVDKIVHDLWWLFDALGDLVLTEGVHQAAQNNPDRAGAHIDVQGDFTPPPEATVTTTPTTGFPLTTRVGLELTPVATAPAGSTPRVTAQPAVAAWVAAALPDLGDVECTVTWTVAGGPQQRQAVSLSELGVEPLDVLELINDEGGSDLAELEDRLRLQVVSTVQPRADAEFTILHMEAGPGRTSVFVASALARRLRALLLQSRPLRAGDVMQPSQGDSADATPHVVHPDRLSVVRDDLLALRNDLETQITVGDGIVADPVTNRAAMLSGIDTRIATVADLLKSVAAFGGVRVGWGALYAWRAELFTDLLARTQELLDRWDDKLTACTTALNDEQAPGLTDEERVRLLRAAEGQVSTALDPETDPTLLRPKVVAKQTSFRTKGDAIRASVIDASNATLSDRLARCAAVLPISDFDAEELTYQDLEDRVVAYWSDLQVLLTASRADVDERWNAAKTAMDEHDVAVDPTARLDALQRGAEAVFGEGFRLVPTFTLPAAAGAEATSAHTHFASGGLLAHATSVLGVDNPLDTWLYGAARVRGKLRNLEDLIMLWEARSIPHGSFHIVQLPHVAGAPWLGLDFDQADTPTTERMTYLAWAGAGHDPAAARCGLLLDEWVETIPVVEPDEPGPQQTTGVAFHFDRPSQEPPQAWLLLTSPTWEGRWQWDDLLQGVIDTFDLARLRAVEPDQLLDTPLGQFVPATIAAVTTTGLNLAAIFALVNAQAAVKRET